MASASWTRPFSSSSCVTTSVVGGTGALVAPNGEVAFPFPFRSVDLLVCGDPRGASPARLGILQKSEVASSEIGRKSKSLKNNFRPRRLGKVVISLSIYSARRREGERDSGETENALFHAASFLVDRPSESGTI